MRKREKGEGREQDCCLNQFPTFVPAMCCAQEHGVPHRCGCLHCSQAVTVSSSCPNDAKKKKLVKI